RAPDRDQHGRAGPLHGQHLRRAVVALAEIRGGVPEGLRIGGGGGHEYRALLPVLQPRALAPKPRLPDAGGDLPGANMKPDGRVHQLSGVFFPSLSRDILWKVGVVSRVRYAAQKPRALDTTPTFQPNLLRRKRREGGANRNHGWPQPAAQTQNPDPVGISLLRAKNGLDNGVHFTPCSARHRAAWGGRSPFAEDAAPLRQGESPFVQRRSPRS